MMEFIALIVMSISGLGAIYWVVRKACEKVLDNFIDEYEFTILNGKIRIKQKP